MHSIYMYMVHRSIKFSWLFRPLNQLEYVEQGPKLTGGRSRFKIDQYLEILL